MTEINFKGKEFVYNHHLSVPFHPLVPDPDKGIGKPALDGNLIIHGDNLHALKSLLPLYAGKVDCVFIDPPYNTGNEGWCYNDNVNAPMIKAWLDANPVGEDDGLRHDKWCAMMWPRLRLLYELLDHHGVMFVTIGDDEAHRLTNICCELFGPENHVATFVWRKVDSPNDNKVAITPDHDYVLCFARDITVARFSRMTAPSILNAYSNRDNEGRLYRDRLLKKNGRDSLRRDRPTMYFGVEGPDREDVFPIHDNGEEARWSMGPNAVHRHRAAGTLIWKKVTKLGRAVWEPYTREYAPEDDPTRPFPTIWSDVDTMRQAKAMLRQMFDTSDLFETPKTVKLIRRIIEMCAGPDALILDSFAGSATTGHAVLEANKVDGGDRRFILVEMEDYADSLTAERIRRVSKGYGFRGKRRTELLRQKITWTTLRRSDKVLDEIQKIENLQGHEYDAIGKTVKDGELIVTGERTVAERVDGLGGSFTYCTLGDPVELDGLLTGEALPSWAQLGAVLFNMATNRTANPGAGREADFYIGEADGQRVWLIYKPDLDWLKSADAALTLSRAREIAATASDAHHLVFAAARYVSQKMLAEQRIPVEFAPLPFALYRIDRS